MSIPIFLNNIFVSVCVLYNVMILCFNWRVAISTSKSSIYETSATTCLNVDFVIENLENGILSIFFLSSKVTLSIPF